MSGRRGADVVRRAKAEVRLEFGSVIRHLHSMEGATVSALQRKNAPATFTHVPVSTEHDTRHFVL